MDNTLDYGSILEDILREESRYPHVGEVDTLCLIDRAAGCYQVVLVGWNDKWRVFGHLVFARLIDGRIWIEYDSLENGLMRILMQRGVPREHIVPAWNPEWRQRTASAIG